MRYAIGVDCGGTFTDCVIIDEDGNTARDKAFSSVGDLTPGILQAIHHAAERWGRTEDEILGGATMLAIGTTSVTNRLVSRTGAKVGLLTTKGHEDAVVIGRVNAKTLGLDESIKGDITAWSKPEPLVPRASIRGIPERVDYKGAVVVPIDVAAAELAIDDLVADGVEAVAVSFLWSFANPDHERRMRDIIRERHPDVFITLSSEIAPVIGEYERSMTTVLNAYLGPGSAHDLDTLHRRFSQGDHPAPVFVMQSNGGMARLEASASTPISLLASGPVGGVMGAATVGRSLQLPNLITADMGGTSFDVGLVVDGVPPFVRSTVYDRCPTVLPTVAVTSIGAGGGSMATVNRETGTLSVGPRSAGSTPGPVCYGRGGTVPTVTDADLVLGRLNPDRFFSGRKQLDVEAARVAITVQIAEPLGMSMMEAAEGIVSIVDGRMADLIRKTTLERGHDPREFVLLAYGGAGPVHIGALARELGIAKAIIPAPASVFSAFGIATSDVRLVRSLSQPMRAPFDVDTLRATFERLTDEARTELKASGFVADDSGFTRSVDMRFTNQFHDISVPVHEDLTTDDDVEMIAKRFLEMYEHRYGEGTAFRPAGIEIMTFRLLATVNVAETKVAAPTLGRTSSRPEAPVRRQVQFDGETVDAEIVWRDDLAVGDVVDGPAIIEEEITTTTVHPGQRATIDDWANLILEGEL